MKIALCLYGKVGNEITKTYRVPTCSKKILTIGADFYKKNLLNSNDVDVFIHSWSLPLKEDILNLYQPKNSIISEQEIFNIPKDILGGVQRTQAHYSRWKSTYEVVKLLEQSTEKYDLVILSRFDIAWNIIPEYLDTQYFYAQQWCCFGENGQDHYNVGLFNKRKEIDISQLTHWHKGLEFGIRDWWFISSKENIIKFGNLYEDVDRYAKIGYMENVISNHGMSICRLKDLNLLDATKLKYHITDTPLIRRSIFKSFV